MNELEQIKTNIINWVTDNISPDFVYRQYQLESIMHIIKSILSDDRETMIIEAPTGSGKSLICIIAAGVLSEYYNKKSYILCSDLFLWKQYADFIKNYNISNFGYLKGSIGNYRCYANKQDLSNSKCKLAKISINQLKNKTWRQRNFFNCFDRCEYMQQRIKAEKSSVTLMTYQLWLHHMNLVNKSSENPSFPSRDIIFCDECHNIPDIVQQFCSPVINEDKDGSIILDLIKYVRNTGLYIKESKKTLDKYKQSTYNPKSAYQDMYIFDDIYNIKIIKKELTQIYDDLDTYQNDNEKLLNILNDYLNILDIVYNIQEYLSNEIKEQTLYNSYKIDKNLLSASHQLTWFESYYSSIKSFIDAINNAGKQYLILDIEKDAETSMRRYLLKCVKEDYLCYNYLLNNSKYKVMLSATVGLHNAFDENTGIKYTHQKISYLSKIPSTFNFDKSPIYFIPTYKMNYANKNTSFPVISSIAIKIINANNCRGIIHTGSYENASMFYRNVPDEIKDRLLLYGNSKQKEEVMPTFKESTNKILVGPTLTEGIDLPDELCRFIIIMKVPYPNITSNIVKKKIELFPLWYNSVTSNMIIQSIGRGVRNESDYCVTYILDGCFGQLYQQTKEQYPDYIQNRLKYLIT